MIAVAPPLEPDRLRPWTIQDYEQMIKTGILQADEPVELIAGQILRKMSPQGSPHAAAITRTNRLFYQPSPQTFTIRIQLPLTLDEFSQPEPDIALVKVDPFDYEERHPRPDEVYLGSAEKLHKTNLDATEGEKWWTRRAVSHFNRLFSTEVHGF